MQLFIVQCFVSLYLQCTNPLCHIKSRFTSTLLNSLKIQSHQRLVTFLFCVPFIDGVFLLIGMKTKPNKLIWGDFVSLLCMHYRGTQWHRLTTFQISIYLYSLLHWRQPWWRTIANIMNQCNDARTFLLLFVVYFHIVIPLQGCRGTKLEKRGTDSDHQST